MQFHELSSQFLPQALRLTVLVDLTEPAKTRRRHYNKGTRYSLRKAERHLPRSLLRGIP